MKLPENVVLDLRKDFSYNLSIKQNDIGSRYLGMTIKDEGKVVNLTNHTAKLYIEKPDGTIIFNSAIIEDAAAGIVEIELTSQALAVAGLLKCELAIYGTDASVASSKIFSINVTNSLRNDTAIESQNEFGALVDGMASLAEYENYKAKINEITTYYINNINCLDFQDGYNIIDKTKLETFLSNHPNIELSFPKGVWYVSEAIDLKHTVSFKLDKDTKIKALNTIDYMFNFTTATVPNSLSSLAQNQRITGGVIDGDNKVNIILKLNNYWGFTIKDVYIKNAINKGIVTYTEGVNPAELVIDNIHLINENSTNYTNNIGIQINSTDNHIQNVFVIDFSTGIEINASANFVNKCHAWISQQARLQYAVGFKVGAGGVGYFSNCFADTMQWGFYNNSEMFLDTCIYSNNVIYTFATTPHAIYLDSSYSRISVRTCTFNGGITGANVCNITSGLLGEGLLNCVYLGTLSNKPQEQLKIGNFSFFPTLVGDAVAGSPTYIAQSGRFTRNGTMVHCDISLKVTLDNTVSGNLQIRNLPYYATWNSNISIGYRSGFGSNTIYGSVEGGTNHIYLLKDSNVSVGADALRGTTVEIYVSATYLTDL